jgi:hypothetical protein
VNPFDYGYKLEPHEKRATGNLRWVYIKPTELSGFRCEPAIPILEQEWEFKAERKDEHGDTWVREGKYWEPVPFHDRTEIVRGGE